MSSPRALWGPSQFTWLRGVVSSPRALWGPSQFTWAKGALWVHPGHCGARASLPGLRGHCGFTKGTVGRASCLTWGIMGTVGVLCLKMSGASWGTMQMKGSWLPLTMPPGKAAGSPTVPHARWYENVESRTVMK